MQLIMTRKAKLYIPSFIHLLTLQDCPCRLCFAEPLTVPNCPCRTFLYTRPPKVARLFACVLGMLLFQCFVVFFVEYGQLYTQSHLFSHNQAFAGEGNLFSRILNMTSLTYGKFNSIQHASGRWACLPRAPDWAASRAGNAK